MIKVHRDNQTDFCGVDFPTQVPDENTIGTFRKILEDNKIQENMFAEVVKILSEKRADCKKKNNSRFNFSTIFRRKYNVIFTSVC